MKLWLKALCVARGPIAAAALLCAGCVSWDLDLTIDWKAQGEGANRVMQLDDARTTNDGELMALLASEDDRASVSAALALGRMPFPEEGAELTRALLETLFDEDLFMRWHAAFALGVRGDPSAADKLVFVALDHHQADREPLVRAAAIEAASKLDRPDLRERILDGLLDRRLEVRLEAAQGASRWPLSEANASAINQRLVEHLASEKDASVITYTLFALERRKAIEALDVFVSCSAASNEEQRLFAVRGLKALAPEPRGLDALIKAAGHDDWRVRCEALGGLAAFEEPRASEQLASAINDSNPHVARTAWESLGAQLERAGQVPRESVDAQPTSTSVRAAQVEAFARGIAKRLETIEFPSFDGPLDYPARANLKDTALRDAYTALQRAGVDESFVVRVGAARAFAHLPAKHALPWLTRLASDAHLAVAGAAIEGLAKHPTSNSRKLLHDFLAHADNGLRLAAVTALAEMPAASDLAPLVRCFDCSTGDGANEIRFNALRSVSKLGGDETRALIARALVDSSPFVRRVAREEARKLGMSSSDIERSLAFRSDAEKLRAAQPLDLAPVSVFPAVEVVTSRGTLTFLLHPLEAPRHVHNFLTLAARDHYDGLTFHRVAPDFVVQGGDYRGDGNGGGTWRGQDEAQRHEITPRKYIRGSLGMPRNEDPGSGGSQFFVTHRATPHLDGRYTIFGQLVEGFEVLDTLEVGDTILDVRLLHESKPD